MALMPEAGLDVTSVLVRGLLREQQPELAMLPLIEVANGWDNVIFRLGNEYAVRLPRRIEAVELILHEQAHLPGYASRTPVPLPVPVFAGKPSSDYPWPWSIVRWMEGTRAAELPAPLRNNAAEDLAAFLTAIHVPADPGAPVNPVRGVPLAVRNDAVRERLEDSDRYRDAGRLRQLWANAVDAPLWGGAPQWLHGDLHSANILLDPAGRLAAVIDFGDLGAGDPAMDLAAAWLVFDAEGRQRFVAAMGTEVNAGTWRRARGWALVLATAMVSNSDDNPLMLASGRFALRQLLDE